MPDAVSSTHSALCGHGPLPGDCAPKGADGRQAVGTALSPRGGRPGQSRPSLRLVPAAHVSLDEAETASRTAQALGTAEVQGSAVLEELETEASGPHFPHINFNIYMSRFTVLYMVILHRRSHLIPRALQGGP